MPSSSSSLHLLSFLLLFFLLLSCLSPPFIFLLAHAFPHLSFHFPPSLSFLFSPIVHFLPPISFSLFLIFLSLLRLSRFPSSFPMSVTVLSFLPTNFPSSLYLFPLPLSLTFFYLYSLLNASSSPLLLLSSFHLFLHFSPYWPVPLSLLFLLPFPLPHPILTLPLILLLTLLSSCFLLPLILSLSLVPSLSYFPSLPDFSFHFLSSHLPPPYFVPLLFLPAGCWWRGFRMSAGTVVIAGGILATVILLTIVAVLCLCRLQVWLFYYWLFNWCSSAWLHWTSPGCWHYENLV